jgi:hypothetical protein
MRSQWVDPPCRAQIRSGTRPQLRGLPSEKPRARTHRTWCPHSAPWLGPAPPPPLCRCDFTGFEMARGTAASLSKLMGEASGEEVGRGALDSRSNSDCPTFSSLWPIFFPTLQPPTRRLPPPHSSWNPAAVKLRGQERRSELITPTRRPRWSLRTSAPSPFPLLAFFKIRCSSTSKAHWAEVHGGAAAALHWAAL